MEDFQALCSDHHFAGLNVTIPFKESVIPYLDEIDEEAENIGAVNVITFRNGKTKGYNTDAWGFKQSLLPVLQEIETYEPKALVLGTGGSARAVCFALRNLCIPYISVSRDPQRGMPYDRLDDAVIEAHQIIINTTPAGMYPDTGNCPPIPYEKLKKTHFLFDLIYNPKKTVFLTKGLQQHCSVKNGLDMLVYQAEKSWEIWNKN
jgi:shikimate dehydrogenase